MSNLVEKLLEPIAGDQACGPDLSYDPRLDEIENLLKGKPEVEIGSVVKPAEPPDWGTLRDRAIDFLGAAKHLRVAVIFACSSLRTDGLEGFRDGLRVVRGLLEKYWGEVHPLLDPDDNNDPQQRLNLLSGLTAPRASVSGWLQTIDYLYQVPLCQARGMAPITLDLLQAAQSAAGNTEPREEGAPPAGPDLASIEAQIRGSDPENLTATHTLVQEALEAANGIDDYLSATLGAGGSISFEELTNTLETLERTIANYLPGAGGGDDSGGGDAGQDEGGGGGGMGAGPAISGSIRSRDDVVRMLDKICDYYRQVEPGSPVPYILRRAQKLAVMNFVDAMAELNLAGVEQLKPSMGSAVEAQAADGWSSE